jgi:hypothetical protein
MKKLMLLLFLLSIIADNSFSQSDFIQKDILIAGEDIHSGVAVGISDINRDGLDDIIVLDEAEHLFVILQSMNGVFKKTIDLGIVDEDAPPWSITAGDLDNNGVSDILVCGPGNGIDLMMGSGLIPEFQKEHINHEYFLNQATNFVDIDRDGLLDFFICNDEGENVLGMNLGNGDFDITRDIIDFTTTPISDGSGNYGSVWCDFDRDGDVDLYVSKCKPDTDMNDPRRINQFFENVDGIFENKGEYYGFDSHAQSWTADFIDVDNDLDWDLFVTNHDGAAELYIQQENKTFVEDAANRGIAVSSFVIQSLAADFDNDGDEDILLTGKEQLYFENDGNGYFSLQTGMFDVVPMESATHGDLNNDGYLDIYGCYGQVFNQAGAIADKLWINKGGDNNWIRLMLYGNSSNRQGIGAIVELWNGGKSQMKELRSGTSYGVNASNLIHAGLGQNVSVDSLIIHWPSGQRDMYPDVLANRIYRCIENSELLVIDYAMTTDELVVCSDSIIQLTALDGYEYLWSTGSQSQQVDVAIDAFYSTQLTYNDLFFIAPSLFPQTESNIPPTIIEPIKTAVCQDEQLILTSTAKSSVIWSDGRISQDIDIVESGLYWLTEDRMCASYNSDTIDIQVTEVIMPVVEHDTALQNEHATLIATGTHVVWWESGLLSNIIHVGDTLEIDNVQFDDTFYVASRVIYQHESVFAGLSEPGSNSAIAGGGNSGLKCYPYTDILLKSLEVYTDTEGPRVVLIEQDETLYYQDTFDLQEGKNTLTFEILLEGQYTYNLKTDAAFNLQMYGTSSPLLMRSKNVDHPIRSKYLSFVLPFLGHQAYYYYFYNWEIALPTDTCMSEIAEVYLTVDSLNARNELQHSLELNLYPNPSNGNFIIDASDLNDRLTSIKIVDLSSIVLYDTQLELQSKMEVKLSNISPGIYFLLAEDYNGSRICKKLVICGD